MEIFSFHFISVFSAFASFLFSQFSLVLFIFHALSRKRCVGLFFGCGRCGTAVLSRKSMAESVQSFRIHDSSSISIIVRIKLINFTAREAVVANVKHQGASSIAVKHRDLCRAMFRSATRKTPSLSRHRCFIQAFFAPMFRGCCVHNTVSHRRRPCCCCCCR
jgi:hypothetical protein